MKSGSRAFGVAASDGDERSTLCGALVRADRVLDDLAFRTCTVGGTDGTRAVVGLFDALDREDVRYLLVAGIAPAWFNLLDLRAVRDAVERPVLSVSFEASPGLEPAIHDQFDGEARERRLAVYRSLPPRRELAVNGETVFVRAVGADEGEAANVVRAFTPEGGRPEPLRVARAGARAGREWLERGDARSADGTDDPGSDQ